MARPRSDPAAVALGLQLLQAGDIEAAVERSGLSISTLYRRKAELVEPVEPVDEAPPGAPVSPLAPARGTRRAGAAAPMAFDDFAALAQEQAGGIVGAAVEAEEDSPFARSLAPAGVTPPTALELLAYLADPAELADAAAWAAEAVAGDEDGGQAEEVLDARALLLAAFLELADEDDIDAAIALVDDVAEELRRRAGAQRDDAAA